MLLGTEGTLFCFVVFFSQNSCKIMLSSMKVTDFVTNAEEGLFKVSHLISKAGTNGILLFAQRNNFKYNQFPSFLKNNFPYLFWLYWVLVAAGLFCSCGEQGSSPAVVCWLLIAVASLVAEHRLWGMWAQVFI